VGMWYDLQAGVDPPMVREISSSLDLYCYDIVDIIGMQASRSAITLSLSRGDTVIAGEEGMNSRGDMDRARENKTCGKGGRGSSNHRWR
jgi:hypothetical protein